MLSGSPTRQLSGMGLSQGSVLSSRSLFPDDPIPGPLSSDDDLLIITAL